ncbi:DUF418 domain-containing protein [bacterium]|nr:DUF418 domain-containing protein [bacterium]
MKERIIGIDIARALAVIGMIIINFKMVFGSEGAGWVKGFAGLFEGKAAATFVVLAGMGMALMTKNSIKDNDQSKFNLVRKKIIKRALFLFIVGISYIGIWPADILHFYGIYMLITLFLLKSSNKTIFSMAFLLIFLYPFLMIFINYERGWNLITFDYLDFWTISGFIRNLFYNGFHPVIPWTSFMLMGYWLGKQDLHDNKFIKRSLAYSVFIFISIQLFSVLLISFLADGDINTRLELKEILGTSPMPPLPIYMISGIAIAFATILSCILIGYKFKDIKLVNIFKQTGQLALTFYVSHVIIGMGIIEALNPSKMGNYSIEFSVGYALIFSFLSMLFANIWLKYKKEGPLEWVIKKIVNKK